MAAGALGMARDILQAVVPQDEVPVLVLHALPLDSAASLTAGLQATRRHSVVL